MLFIKLLDLFVRMVQNFLETVRLKLNGGYAVFEARSQFVIGLVNIQAWVIFMHP